METKFTALREALAEAVPDSGTDRRLVRIDVDRLRPDPRNFYELSDIDELAANIELFGLQQPLLVRPDPDEAEGYVIVSGHRRREALALLVRDGREDLRQVPCIVEDAAGSEALQELRLIFANSDTRKMTSAEISRQAERVEALLYELKEAGYAFPGRMRDHVAEACKVSKSKLSRLKVIREGLCEAFLVYWERGDLNESVAYELARLPEADQVLILDNVRPHPFNYTAYDVNLWRETLLDIRQTPCPGIPGESECLHTERRFRERFFDGEVLCARNCCCECYKLARCQTYCPAAETTRRIKIKETEMAKEEEAARLKHIQEEDRETESKALASLTARWARVGEVVKRSGLDDREAALALGLCSCEDEWEDEAENIHSLLAGRPPKLNDPDPILPYCLMSNDLDDLCDTADRLGVSLDYLLGRTDEPGGAPGEAVWRAGTPPRPGRYYALFDPEAPMEIACRWTGEAWEGPFGNVIAYECCGWWPLPEKE